MDLFGSHAVQRITKTRELFSAEQFAQQSISGKKFSTVPLPPAPFFSIDPCLQDSDGYAEEKNLLLVVHLIVG